MAYSTRVIFLGLWRPHFLRTLPGYLPFIHGLSSKSSEGPAANRCARSQSRNKLILILADGKVTHHKEDKGIRELRGSPGLHLMHRKEVNKRWTVSTPTLTCPSSFFHFYVFLFVASCFVNSVHAYPVLETATAHPFMQRECWVSRKDKCCLPNPITSKIFTHQKECQAWSMVAIPLTIQSRENIQNRQNMQTLSYYLSTSTLLLKIKVEKY